MGLLGTAGSPVVFGSGRLHVGCVLFQCLTPEQGKLCDRRDVFEMRMDYIYDIGQYNIWAWIMEIFLLSKLRTACFCLTGSGLCVIRHSHLWSLGISLFAAFCVSEFMSHT